MQKGVPYGIWIEAYREAPNQLFAELLLDSKVDFVMTFA